MSAVASSPKTETPPKLTPEQARADWIALCSPQGGGLSSTAQIVRYGMCGGFFDIDRGLTRWASCCGSKAVNKDGMIVAGLNTFHPTNLEQARAITEKRYGKKLEERFGKGLEKHLQSLVIIDLPGAYVAEMPLKDALDTVFTDKVRERGEGYEVNDPDMGTLSFFWLTDRDTQEPKL